MQRLPAVPALALGAVGVLLVATACSSEGGREQSAEDAEAVDLTIAMITHQVQGDTFWDIVRTGAEAAADKSGVDLEYAADPEAREQANLVQNAVDRGVDGIAVTLPSPDTMEGALEAAEAADIPVVALNSGIDDWQDLGVQQYFGTDEYLAGEAFGARLDEEGLENVVCVIHEQGNIGLESRCEGLAAEFAGQTETLYVDSANMPEVRSALSSRLEESTDVDLVAALGAPIAITALDAIGDAGSEAAVATFDTNAELVAALQDGDVLWAVDQQPYLQGYLSVESLWLYRTNGNTLGGGEPVLTGPAFIDDTNIDDVAEYAERGTR
ncbi:substrate-binding domain-containing protein [Nocardiopsis sp. MG754419]|uniref:substrate-binding domain-containing protein n=1 Tax=Nocardiopsis sp. MG754419 TaxID=2259865 RepID=UPI001BAD1041|nr:substrate-binding domain-containing protein [Nocardiopsis sp. MG754419]MBR8743175.1 sugar ABC transporter substrate-binding protein [Nocardiopsis sp. MG754419]